MEMLELQQAVFQNKCDKGFNVTDVSMEFCLLYGEVGEAYEAYLKKQADLGEELADIAIYLLGLAEILGLDLGASIEAKMAKNRKREYEVIDGVLKEVKKS